MNPRARTILGALAASIAAGFLGWQIAEGSYGLPAVTGTLIVVSVVIRLTKLPVDAILLGLLLAGYIDGNRGFAQLMPFSDLPLLPAEIGLGVAVAWRALRCAFERRLPLHRDALNGIVLVWLIAGTARVAFDAPRYGFLALRDYAVVYYAVFFFIAQDMGRDPKCQRYLRGCLVAAMILLVPLFFLSQVFPYFFLTQFTFRGVPVIFYKGDLAATFLAAGSVLVFHFARGAHRYWLWPLSAAMFLTVAAGENRASLLAGCFACALLLAARRWRYPAVQGAVAVSAVLAVAVLATAFNHEWSERKLAGLTDRLVSVADVSGTGQYKSEENIFKGDNNRFRMVWWRNVLQETWDTNPVFGLGFGADLARGFLEEYFPDAGEDFSARSPHSIFVTVAGRMGLAGLLIWLSFCAVFLQRTWASLRRTDAPNDWALWCGAWVILISAGFGVVLESPMGAVLFWTMLGLANARLAEIAEAGAAEPERAPEAIHV